MAVISEREWRGGLVPATLGEFLHRSTSAPTTHKCRGCGAPVSPGLDFGLQPLANGFVPAAEARDAPRYPLRVGACRVCGLWQLLEQPPAAVLFNERYPFLTGASAAGREHCAVTAQSLLARYQPRRVLEIGCNDGTLGQHFLRHTGYLGIEPSAGVADLARAKGLDVRTAFWGEALGRDLARNRGQFDLVIGQHVFSHCSDPNDFLCGVRHVLAPDGVLVFEDPSLLEILERYAFDQVYDEHATYLSLPAVAALAARHGLEVIDAEPVEVHGGSLRVHLARHGTWHPSERVAARLKCEQYLAGEAATTALAEFASRVHDRIAALRELVRSYRVRGLRVAAYAATSKSTLVFNACGFTPDEIEYISDTTPMKWGLCQPGTGIPIISREEAQGRLPDVWLLSAWNWRRAIMAQERGHFHGKWATWVPCVHAWESGSTRYREAES